MPQSQFDFFTTCGLQNRSTFDLQTDFFLFTQIRFENGSDAMVEVPVKTIKFWEYLEPIEQRAVN